MIKELEDFFREEKIDAYAAIPFSAVRVEKPHLLGRDGFMPETVILFLLPYYGGECENLSRYAAAKDYHLAIRAVTDRLCERIKGLFPDARVRGYGDHSPIAEVDAALSAGLGVIGKNGLLISKDYGSYVFIADVLTDVSPEKIGAIAPLAHRTCEGCGKCLSACPTGILRGEGTDCLSAITQRKGDLTDEEAALLRKFNTVWGCDLCQSSCPHNAHPKISPIPFFSEERITRLDADALAALDDEAFAARAFAWRGRAVVMRNVSLFSKKAGESEKNS